ncbi:MAG: hypothetical protein ACP5O0_05855 [Acidimicrobiales bacterium]
MNKSRARAVPHRVRFVDHISSTYTATIDIVVVLPKSFEPERCPGALTA